jgi:hypothetical protein
MAVINKNYIIIKQLLIDLNNFYFFNILLKYIHQYIL